VELISDCGNNGNANFLAGKREREEKRSRSDVVRGKKKKTKEREPEKMDSA
jgi:hypothetical protein